MNYEALPGIEEALRQVQERKMSKEAHKKAAKAGKRWQDNDGDGKWYEPGDDVKKEEYDNTKPDPKATAEKKARLEKKRGMNLDDHPEYKKEEVELDENRAAARAAGGYKDDSKKQTDPSKAGFTGISGSIKDIMRQNKEIEAANKAKAKKEEVEIEEGLKNARENIGRDPNKPSCWKGYVAKGTKMKGGKEVPNCVPANEELEAMEASLMESGLFSDDEVRYIIGEKFDELEEATAMAKRGHDETAIRNKIAANTGGGKSADRATALEKKPTYGNDKAAKQRSDYARKQRGDFRKTTSSSPGLHGYAHKATNDADKAKQAARGAQRGALTPNEKKDLGR